eukprot:g33641.t1
MGGQVANADALSCLRLADSPLVVPPLEESVMFLTVQEVLPITADNIRLQTQKDPVLEKLKLLVEPMSSVQVQERSAGVGEEMTLRNKITEGRRRSFKGGNTKRL